MRFRNEDVPDFSGVAWEPFASDFVWSLTPGDGVKMVHAEFRNAAGENAAASDDVTISTAGPAVMSFALDNGKAYTKDETIPISAAVDGAEMMRLGNEIAPGSILWESPVPVAAARTWKLLPGDGPKKVRAEFFDDLGNVTPVSGSITLDTTPLAD
jgi:hypothetical protein